MRRAARVDSTQEAIVATLRGVGALVWIIGKEIDLVCQFRGQKYLLDCKSKGTRVTANQLEMAAEGWDIDFVHSVDEALAAIGAIDKPQTVSPPQRLPVARIVRVGDKK